MNLSPIISITMGDPAGVGPEVTAKALARNEVWDCCRPLVIGDTSVLVQAVALVDAPLVPRPVTGVAEAHFDPTAPDVLDLQNVDTSVHFLGKRLCSPLIVSSMTGGTKEAKSINHHLAQAAQEAGIGMGLGSQRASIRIPP